MTSRMRSVNQDMALDEAFATLSPLAKVLKLLLPTMADRDGRLEDRPRSIRTLIFPHAPDVDVDVLLNEMAQAGTVQRYEALGEDGTPVRCIAFTRWKREQRPHPKETSFHLPVPPSREVSRQGADASRRVPLGVVVGSGNGNGSSASQESAADAAGVQFAPEDAPAPEPPPTAGSRAAPTAARVASGPTPEELQALWNRFAKQHGLPQWEAMGDKRRRAADARLREEPRLEAWESFLTAKVAEPFYRGQNERGWKADPKWLLRPDRSAEVTDHSVSASPPKGASTRPLHPEEQRALDQIRAQRRATTGAQPQ